MFENSRLSRYKVGKIIECFCIDIDVTRTALLLKLNRKTVNRYFLAFRRLIYLHQVSKKEQILGVVEIDESFFGPAWVRGRPGPRKRGRGTLKQPVFGIYERDGAVYTELVTNCSAKTLQAIIGCRSPFVPRGDIRRSAGPPPSTGAEIGRARVGKECRSRWSPYH